MKSNFRKIVKNFLKHLPKNDYPVLSTRRFVSCWLGFVLDQSLTSMRDLLKRLNIGGIKMDISTFSKASQTRDIQVFIDLFNRLRPEVFRQVSREELGFFPLDSTSITLTSKLFYDMGYSQVKLFAGQDLSSGSIEGVKVNFGSGHDSKYGNETVNAIPYNSVGIMDRGFASCERIQELLKKSNCFFLLRIKKNFSLKMLENGHFKIGQKDKECEARVVSFCDLKSQEEYRLVTNISAEEFGGFNNYEIAEMYKRRWQIELLWKFLKMHLKLDKLITKNTNGVTIQIYVCLIAYLILKLVRVAPEFNDDLLFKLNYLQVFMNKNISYIHWFEQLIENQ